MTYLLIHLYIKKKQTNIFPIKCFHWRALLYNKYQAFTRKFLPSVCNAFVQHRFGYYEINSSPCPSVRTVARNDQLFISFCVMCDEAYRMLIRQAGAQRVISTQTTQPKANQAVTCVEAGPKDEPVMLKIDYIIYTFHPFEPMGYHGPPDFSVAYFVSFNNVPSPADLFFQINRCEIVPV